MNRTETPSDAAAINVDELVTRCLGHLDFAERILSKFHARCPEELRLLEESVRSEDTDGIVQVAHRWKGAAANVAAARLRDEVAEIERLGRAGRIPEIPAKVPRVREAWLEVARQVAGLDWSQAAR